MTFPLFTISVLWLRPPWKPHHIKIAARFCIMYFNFILLIVSRIYNCRKDEEEDEDDIEETRGYEKLKEE